MGRNDDDLPASKGRSNLTAEELEAEAAVELPDREAMTTIQGPIGLAADNLAMPINEATAANVNSDYSVAIADADQFVIVDQTDTDPDVSATDSAFHPGPDRFKG